MSIYASPGSVLAVGVIFPALATIAVGLRFWARRAQKAPLLIDDWLIVIALVMAIAGGICIIIGVAGRGLAYHTPPPETDGPDAYLYAASPEGVLALKLIYVLQVLATLGFGSTKLSIVYFYRRVFCISNRASLSTVFSKVTWGVLIFLYMWIVAFLVGFVFDCGLEFWANWGPLNNDYSYCQRTFAVTAAFTFTDVASDLVVILLPIRTIWKLQISLSQRIAVICIFLMGALTIILSALRVILFAIWYYEGTQFLRDMDIVCTEMAFWINITAGLGIITACLPTVQVLLRKLPLEWLRNSFSSFKSSIPRSSASRTTWFRFNSTSTESVLPRTQNESNTSDFSQFQLQRLSFSEQPKTVR